MKKIVLVSIISLLLAWCWTQTSLEQSVSINDKQESKQDVSVYYLEDNMWFEYDWVKITPKNIEEKIELEEVPFLSIKMDNVVAWDYSKYVIVESVLENLTKDEIKISADKYPKITDSQWRSYSSLIDCKIAGCRVYVDNLHKEITLKPWIPETNSILYEVARDSDWLYFSTKVNWKEERIILNKN